MKNIRRITFLLLCIGRCVYSMEQSLPLPELPDDIVTKIGQNTFAIDSRKLVGGRITVETALFVLINFKRVCKRWYSLFTNADVVKQIAADNSPDKIANLAVDGSDMALLQKMITIFRPAEISYSSSKYAEPSWVHYAVQLFSTDCIETLIKYGYEFDRDDTIKRTPLFATALHGCVEEMGLPHGRTTQFFLNDAAIKVIHLLVQSKANINAQNKGETLLHTAVIKNSAIAYAILKALGANDDLKNEKGKTVEEEINGTVFEKNVEFWLYRIKTGSMPLTPLV